MVDRDARRALIRDAIRDVKPKADAPVDFVVDRIEWILDEAASAVDVLPITPNAAAKELDRLAAALSEVEEASDALSKVSVEALNQAKFRHGLKWFPDQTVWSFLRGNDLSAALAERFPDIRIVLAEAASDLRRAKRPRRTRRFPLALATVLAGHFKTLTDEEPGKGRGGLTRFAAFVALIFQAGEINKNKSEHYAALGAAAHEQQNLGDNPPEISWFRA
jgi:hypothetical protein